MRGQHDLPNGEDNFNNDEPLSDIWYTAVQVMAIFKISISTLGRWRRLKVNPLKCCKINGFIWFNKTDVDNFRRMHRR
jgi:hypothetical protein